MRRWLALWYDTRLRVTALAGGAGALIILFVFSLASSWATERALALILELAPDATRAGIEQCHASPHTFERHVRRGAVETVAWGYDLATGRSLNRVAPPLREETLARLRGGAQVVVHIDALARPGTAGGYFATTLGTSPGPCSVFVVRWPRMPRFTALRLSALAYLSGGAFLIVALAVFLALTPFLRRLRALEVAAARIGLAAGIPDIDAPQPDEFNRLTDTLQRTHQRVQETMASLEASRTALAAHLEDIAHDFRTPLTAATLELESLAPRLVEREQVAALQRVLDELTHLGDLTGNLHLAGQLRGGIDPRSDVAASLSEIVRRVTHRFEVLGRHRGIRVAGAWPDDPALVLVRAEMVEQALSNLVRNASIHNHSGAHAAILLAVEPDGAFVLQVIDDGPGLDEPDAARLLERWRRGDVASQRATDGSGLGLAIVGALCARVGWQLAFERTAPTGLTVTLRGSTVSAGAASPVGRTGPGPASRAEA